MTSRAIFRRQGIRIALPVALLLIAQGSAFAGPSGQPPKILFTAPLSGDSDLPDACELHASESLPQVERVPGSPDELRAVYLQDGGEAAVGASSADGGRSWTLTPVGGSTGCTGGPEGSWTANPFLSVGPEGTTYYGNSWLAGSAQGVAVHRWDSPEQPWTPGTSPDGSQSAQNANVVADPSDPSGLAMMWSHFQMVDTPARRIPVTAELRFARSSDGGITFSPARSVAAPGPGRYAVNSVLRRDPSTGALVAIYSVADIPSLAVSVDPTASLRGSLELLAIRSTDGGETWSEPVLLGAQGFVKGHDPDDDPVEIALLNGTAYASVKPDLAIGPHGAVAVAWTDPAAADTTAVQLALSQGGGQTWSRTESRKVSSQVIEPAVAFSDKGALGVFFYDFRNDVRGDDSFDLDAWLQTSTDGGETWQELHLAGPFDLSASNSCSYPTPVPAFERQNCTLAFDATELGVYQDLVGLSNGFGAAYTVAPPLTADGFTDVLYTRVLSP